MLHMVDHNELHTAITAGSAGSVGRVPYSLTREVNVVIKRTMDDEDAVR